MDNEQDGILDSSPEQEEKVEVQEEPEQKIEQAPEEKPAVPYNRFKEVNEKKKILEAELNKLAQQKSKGLDVEDYIDISASLDGLDPREKERLAKEHKLTGRPLKEIRDDEDFKLWQTAYRAKVEKEQLTLKPSNNQGESDIPKSFGDKLKSAKTMKEKEELLASIGLYQEKKIRTDKGRIG